MAEFIIKIPNWHPHRLNELMNVHWAKAAKMKKEDFRKIWTYAIGKPRAETKRELELTIILKKGQRSGDPDAYSKSLNDALVKAKLLVNDSPKWLRILPVNYERAAIGEWGTVITMRDV